MVKEYSKRLIKGINNTNIPLRSLIIFILFLIFVGIGSLFVCLFQRFFFCAGDKISELIGPIFRRIFQ